MNANLSISAQSTLCLIARAMIERRPFCTEGRTNLRTLESFGLVVCDYSKEPHTWALTWNGFYAFKQIDPGMHTGLAAIVTELYPK